MKTRILSVIALAVLVSIAGFADSSSPPTPGEVTVHMLPTPHDFNLRGWHVHYELADHTQFPPPSSATLMHWNITATRQGKTVTYFGGVLYGLFELNTPQGLKLLPVFNDFVFQMTK